MDFCRSRTYIKTKWSKQNTWTVSRFPSSLIVNGKENLLWTLFTPNQHRIKGYSPKKSSIRRSCDTGSSISWSPLTTSNCSRGKTSNHLCTWTWYCDIASGRYASLTVPFGRIAKSSNDLDFFGVCLFGSEGKKRMEGGKIQWVAGS